jgi:hypothetical protein
VERKAGGEVERKAGGEVERKASMQCDFVTEE